MELTLHLLSNLEIFITLDHTYISYFYFFENTKIFYQTIEIIRKTPVNYRISTNLHSKF